MPHVFLGHNVITAGGTTQRVYSTNNAAYGNGQYRVYVWPTQFTMRFGTASNSSDAIYCVAAQPFCLGIGNPYDFYVECSTTGAYYGLWLVPVGEAL
jgi:hypothetical protein